MKNLKMCLSAFAVLAIVSSALAFKYKSAFGMGTVFCLAGGTITGACPIEDLVNFEVNPSGTTTDPCTGTIVPHINSGGNCVSLPSTTRYSPTLPGN